METWINSEFVSCIYSFMQSNGHLCWLRATGNHTQKIAIPEEFCVCWELLLALLLSHLTSDSQFVFQILAWCRALAHFYSPDCI